MATTVLVTDVPIFAPRTMGITRDTGAPPPTRPTRIEVEVDDDWTNTVIKTPHITPTTGLESKEDSSKKTPIFLPPVILNPVDKKEREQMKK